MFVVMNYRVSQKKIQEMYPDAIIIDVTLKAGCLAEEGTGPACSFPCKYERSKKLQRKCRVQRNPNAFSIKGSLLSTALS